MMLEHTVEVALGERSYPIWVGRDLLGSDRWRERIRGRHVLLVSNETVAPLYADRVRAGLEGLVHAQLTLPDGEQHKTLASAERIFGALGELGATRDACLVALGGGVVGDMTGFAAACWMRGVDFVQMPTSLLAMADASVGGKTGVNLAFGKNLVGAFHQPRAVVIDTDVLVTLPPREYAAGLAEIIKHAAIGDAAFFIWLEASAKALRERDPAAVARAVEHACRFKAAVVARDETEQGARALLNFGHTFGHALETLGGYGKLLHGEAVAIGMCQAAQLSAASGLAGSADLQRLRKLLQAVNLPVTPPAGLAPQRLLDCMRLDKKNRAGHLRLILWRGIGEAFIADGIADEAILPVLGDTTAATG